MSNINEIPVLAFHSIGIENSSWSKRYLSSPLSHFEELCRYLVEQGYETIFLDEWNEMEEDKFNNRYKKIVLTFDDGYLDNWVYVFPLLVKYNLKATIFVNPEFVDPSAEPRKNLQDVWKGKINFEDLQPVGFLNWTEMQLMEHSGRVDIQSHSMTHDTYFKSDTMIDLYDGSEKYDWLPWIYFKDTKPYYMRDNLFNAIKYGVPIFENDRSLAVRRFLPSDSFIDYCVSEYNRFKGTDKSKKFILEEISGQINNGNEIGRYETEAEQVRRYEYELKDSKRIIEDKLNKKVHYLCWPGGRYNEHSLKLSIDTGYRASTATKKSEGDSIYSEKGYKRILRIGMGSKVDTSRSIMFNKNNKGLIYCYKEYTGASIVKSYLKYKRRFLSLLYQIKI